MKTLSSSQTRHVSGGLSTPDAKHGAPATSTVESPSKTQAGWTALTFSPSHPDGLVVRLSRYDAVFMAPSDSLSEDQPLFPGLNDQGGVV